MARTKSSGRWLQRHVTDPYVKRARKEGYRSRAAFKLAEIDERERLFRPGMTVVDLGAAPGGWSQYARGRVGADGRVIALDVLPMEEIPGVEFIHGDFTEEPVLHLLEERLRCAGTRECRGRQDAGSGAGRVVDLVISDMAPNISGITVSDQARSVYLAELALDFADKHLKPGGGFLVKTFQGEGFPAFLRAMQGRFGKVVTRKPKASRAESREIYLYGRGFKGGG
jgi:23S rRNA (uridine2552-2'-O)-methyltransferase